MACTMRLPRLTLAALLALAAAAWGCQASPSPGATGGRIDPYRSTPADVYSPQVSMPVLYELCDKAAQTFAQELSDVPQIRDADERLVLELGTIHNRTRTSTADFELIQHRLRSQLRSSPFIREHFMFVEGAARMDREQAQVEGYGEPTSRGGSARYAPGGTYVLQGDFFESVRGNVRRYFLELKVTQLETREIVLAEEYDLGQAIP